MRRPQFRLRSLFILTALVAVGCLVGPPAWGRLQVVLFPPPTPRTVPYLDGYGRRVLGLRRKATMKPDTTEWCRCS